MDYLKALPKSDLILLLEILHASMAAQNPEQFEDSLGKITRLLLYDGLTCILSDMDTIKNKKPVYHIHTKNFSEEFAKSYVKEGHYQKSAVFRKALKTSRPLHWKTMWRHENSTNSIGPMKLAYNYGYKDGWITANCCMNDPSVTLVVIAGEKVDTDHRTAAILKCITPHLAESLRGLFIHNLKEQKRNENYKLTPRELEVLRWIMDGKSTWDISVIFGRSERVVKWHINNIMQKLCAQNRTHAVAIAMRQGLIQ